jgi:HAD superfamily hydrolase (TIGR01549 family)
LKQFDWVFLDAGETLFDVQTTRSGFGEMLSALGYPRSPEHLAVILNEARVAALEPDHVGPAPDYEIAVDRALARRERLIGAILQGVVVQERDYQSCRAAVLESWVGHGFFGLYPDALDALGRLRAAGYRMGVISNWEPRLEILCQNHGLANYLDFVLASEAEGFAKPGPHLFRQALALAGVEPTRAVHVGDSYEHDIVGASALGIPAVLLDRGGYYEENQWQPTIRTLAELPELLAGSFPLKRADS